MRVARRERGWEANVAERWFSPAPGEAGPGVFTGGILKFSPG